MEIKDHFVVLDADDITAVSAFWGRLLGGEVEREDGWHTVRSEGPLQICVQHAPGLVKPEWPDGPPQQIHLDLVVADISASHDEAVSAGAAVLEAPDSTQDHGFAVYADPAGHPFCLCW